MRVCLFFLSHFLDILDSFVFWEGIGRGLLYGMFIVYLWYIYPIFIVYLSYVVDKEKLGL